MSNNEDRINALGNSDENECNCQDKRKSISYEPHTEPPFWGTGEILSWKPKRLVDLINKEELFKKQVAGKVSDADFEKTKKNVLEPFFEKYTKEIVDLPLITPRGFFGYFPSITDNDSLIFIDPADFCTELAEFKFPRMNQFGCVSLADYFNPDGDIIGVQVVTIGVDIAKKESEPLANKDNGSDEIVRGFLNNIGSAIVEIMADRVSAEVARGVGLAVGYGSRYSFGGLGMPPLSDLEKIFEIMGIDERLGISLLKPEFGMIPNHSSVGIFVRHREAGYLK